VAPPASICCFPARGLLLNRRTSAVPPARGGFDLRSWSAGILSGHARTLRGAGTPADPANPSRFYQSDGPYRFMQPRLSLDGDNLHRDCRSSSLPSILLLPVLQDPARRNRAGGALEHLFGEEYLAYKARGGRWIARSRSSRHHDDALEERILLPLRKSPGFSRRNLLPHIRKARCFCGRRVASSRKSLCDGRNRERSAQGVARRDHLGKAVSHCRSGILCWMPPYLSLPAASTCRKSALQVTYALAPDMANRPSGAVTA